MAQPRVICFQVNFCAVKNEPMNGIYQNVFLCIVTRKLSVVQKGALKIRKPITLNTGYFSDRAFATRLKNIKFLERL